MPPKRKRTTKTAEEKEEEKERKAAAKKQKEEEKAAAKKKKEEEKAAAKAAEPKIDWKNSAAKQVLKKLFREKTVPAEYSKTIGPKKVWEDYCQNDPAFVGMSYGETFTSRLRSVRDDHLKKVSRAERDQKAFNNFRENHERPTHDHRGKPLWDGSDAQKFLKEDMEAGKHENKTPAQLWASRPAYKVYDLPVFRDHIYQEKRLKKFENYTIQERSKKMMKAVKEAPPSTAAAAIGTTEDEAEPDQGNSNSDENSN